jgi:hypothetical protein
MCAWYKQAIQKCLHVNETFSIETNFQERDFCETASEENL